MLQLVGFVHASVELQEDAAGGDGGRDHSGRRQGQAVEVRRPSHPSMPRKRDWKSDQRSSVNEVLAHEAHKWELCSPSSLPSKLERSSELEDNVIAPAGWEYPKPNATKEETGGARHYKT